MTTSRRAPTRRDVTKRRRSFLRSTTQRRIGHVEALEPRALLAADTGVFVSDYWNHRNPNDVNADARVSVLDLMAVVNSLTAEGARALPGRTIDITAGSGTSTPSAAPLPEAAGESAGEQTYFVDANNDGRLNMLDLMQIVNRITAEGEGLVEEPIVRFRVEPVLAGTVTPLPTDAQGRYIISEGDYYELRVMVQDTGVLNFGSLSRSATFDPDGAGGDPPKSAVGVSTAFLDMTWDTSKTGILVTETQTVNILGSPTGIEVNPANPTRFRLTFNGVQTAPIPYSLVPAFTARNIRDALVTALGANGRTDVSNLRNVEVEPLSATSFKVRFINDLADQDFATMTATLTTAAGASGVNVTTNVDGNPNSAASFREMFRGRLARDQESNTLDILNDPMFFDTTGQFPLINGERTADGFNDSGSVSPVTTEPSADRPGTELVEVFRLPMKAVDGDGAPVTFLGSVEDLNIDNFFVTVYGFNPLIPANLVAFDPAPQLLIVEPISAVNDTRTIDEGPAASIVIDVLANDLDSTAPVVTDATHPTGDLVIASFTQPAFGTVTQVGSQLRYTVPDGDFQGEATFTYTIRDGVNGAITDTGTVTVNVRATNDPPVNSVPGAQTMDEDQPGGLVFSDGTGNAISISDVDAATGVVSVTLTATGGNLALNSAAIVNLATVTGNFTGTIVATGTIDNLNAALSGLRYTPTTANFNGSATLTILTSDLGLSQDPGITPQVIGTDLDIINISITPVNDPPINTVPGAQTVDEGATLTFSAANSNLISVADVDANDGVAPILTVTLTASAGSQITPDASSGAQISGSGTASATISGTVEVVNEALSGMTYFRANPLTDILTVTTTDNGNTGGSAATDVDTVTINVVATSRPRAIDDVFPISGTILETAPFVDLDVLLNDLSNLGETRRIDSVVVPAGFTVEIRPADGIIPREHLRLTSLDSDFFGQVSFEYTMSETDNVPVGPGQLPNSGPDVGLVTVTITNVNDIPVGVADNYSTNEDVPLSPPLSVLANDTDADNRLGQDPVDTLTAELVAGSTVGGSVNLSSNGTFTFTPAANFHGAASFQYRVLDGKGGVSADTLVSITVNPVADAPVANPDPYNTNEGINLVVDAASGLLANDTDADNQTPPLNAGLTVDVTTVTQPAQGSVAVLADGSFTYTLPNSDFNGQVTFTYQARDTTGLLSPPATVTITIAPVNDPPVAGDATYLAVENQTRTVTAAEGLLRATSPIVTDVDTPLSGITVAVVTPPAVGVLSLNSQTGAFTYTPPAEFNGLVTFTYRASDGAGSFSGEGTITIDVAAVNNAPTAINHSFSTDEDTSITITSAQLLAGSSDPESNPLTVSAVSGFSGPGTFVQNGDGSVTFTPAAGFPAPNLTGTVTFQYTLTDGPNQSNQATVTITVNERNDNPIANDDTANDLVKDIANQLIVPGPLGNDSAGVDAGVPGEVLSIFSVAATSAQGGTLTLSGGQIRYTPAPGFFGSDSFVYTLTDGRGGFDTATVSFTVLDFVPKTISGTVYIDKNNNGVYEPHLGESPVSGVRVDLTGTSVVGAVNRFDETDAAGFYSFTVVAPGDYTLTQTQPFTLASGKDRASTSPATAGLITNLAELDNKFVLGWSPLDFSGNITGLNFGERGVNAASLLDASGLMGELLASSGSSGMVFSVNTLGAVDWSYTLTGWSATASCQLEFAANGSIPSLLLTIGGMTKRIYQDPHNNHGGNTPATGSQARFRVLGTTGSDYIIRLDGTLAEFGFVAAAPVEGGEGESATEMSDGEYRSAADEVFAEEAWA